MICGSSKFQGKKRIRDLEREGVWVWDRPHNPHGRWVKREGGDPSAWWGEFVPTKRKEVK
jgi:hypothetical protein